MVEFALVLPLLLLVVFGMIEFGRAVNYWIDSNHLANAAARWAVVDNNPGEGGGQSLQSYILSQANTAELREGGTSAVPAAAEVCISFPDGTSEVGDPVEATVTVDYNWMPFIDLDVATTELTGSATMRLEAEPSEYAEECS